MDLLSKEQAIARMNAYGKRRSPFIFVINYRMDASIVARCADIDATELAYDFDGFTNVVPSAMSQEKPCEIKWHPQFSPFESYRKSFDVVRKNIFAGNAFLVNLTCKTPVETNLSLADLFYHTQARYRLMLRDQFTLFSPEPFVRVEGGEISSYPMKGTLDATLPDAEKLLLADEKEKAEHATIVDLLRNDLSRVAREVRVENYRYVEELQTNRGPILQTSTEVRGRLSEGHLDRLGSILFELLPAGSITGAPKCKVMQIVDEAEGYARGFYTGVMGYFDGERLDSAVMIRFVEQCEEGLCYKSGGGITCRSSAAAEYEEMKQKVYAPLY